MNGRLLLAHYEGRAGSVLAGRGQGPGSDLSPSISSLPARLGGAAHPGAGLPLPWL